MKTNNINKKIIAGVLGGIMLSTPLALTGCNSYEYVTDNDGSVKLNPDKMYSYNDVKKLYVIKIKTKIIENLYITYTDNYVLSGVPMNYYDVFTGKEIIHNNSNGIVTTEGVELLSEEEIEQYLISYNMLKDSYSVEDLEGLLERIKQDVYSDTNDKILVKEK